MAITTVDIDKALLDEAKAALGADTVKLTVYQALREVVMRRRQVAALDGIAALDLDLEPEKIAAPAAEL